MPTKTPVIPNAAARESSLNTTTVSIVIPNWNGIDYLEQLLKSIDMQTYANHEVIVVDCVSSDNSVSFIRENFPHFKLIELDVDNGPTNALKVGVDSSGGDYVLLLNNDVILPPDCLDVLVHMLKLNEDSVISPIELDFSGKYRRAGECFSLLPMFFKRFGTDGEVGPFYPLVACCICTRETLVDTPFNVNLWMYEELEWAWRLRLKRTKIEICYDTYYLHKGEATSTGNSPKQAFLYGRLMIAQCFICLKTTTLFILSPFIVKYYLKLWGGYIKRRQWRSLVSGVKGFVNFFLNIRLFISDRDRAQSQRKIGDWSILRAMNGSLIHLDRAREKYERMNFVQ